MKTAEGAAEAPSWAGFIQVLVLGAALLFLAGIGFLLAVDPYGTGRTGLLGRRGIPDQNPTTATASRARDPAFDAAIFGNSRMQQLRPERLDKATGRAFVSLVVPGSGPKEQLAVLRWYLARGGPPPRAVVIGLDAPWCLPETPASARFPDWLYDESILAYVAGLARYRSFEAAAARIAFLRTGRGGARPDGYWDYVPVFAKLGLADPDASRRRIESIDAPTFGSNPTESFPALDALRRIIARMPVATAFVLVRPPVHARGLPKPGSPEEAAMHACAARVEAIAAGRPGVHVVDLLRPGPIAAEFGNFYDYDHYRDPVAVEIETLIAAQLGAA